MIYIQNFIVCRSLFRSLIPCCSSTSNLSNGSRRFFSFSHPHFQNDETSNDSDPKRLTDRPLMFHLEHVQNRLDDTVPMMFQIRLDYTFYRKDVVLDDRILRMKKVGLESLIFYWGGIAMIGKILFPYIRMEPLNILPILEDGTVRLRWRIHYLTWLSIFDYRTYKQEYRVKNARWFDGYSIFHVDGNGLVYHVIMQQIMPDDPRILNQSKKIVEKLGSKLAGNTTTATSPTNFRKEESVEKSKSFSKN